jgi:hypothetical protein
MLKKLGIIAVLLSVFAFMACELWFEIDDEGNIKITLFAELERDLGEEFAWIEEIPVQYVRSYEIKDGSTTIISSAHSGDSKTKADSASASVNFKARLELDIEFYEARVFCNGVEVFTEIGDDKWINADIALQPGENNYIVLIIYDKDTGERKGRSELLRVKSTRSKALWQFQLTWDRRADLDLYIDDGEGGSKVYYGNPKYEVGDWHIELDNDDQNYGPESIVIYSLPQSDAALRCYVNYHTAYSSLSIPATVTIFSNGQIIDTKTHTFSEGDVYTESGYSLIRSWEVMKIIFN